MLMFVFGAGASFDSDPERRPDEVDPEVEGEFRPPLAAGLLTPTSNIGRQVISEFPRAGPLLMNLRQATRQGLDIEEVLEQVAAAENSYPETAVQLLAFRAFLARLMDKVPGEWVDECQGLTNYVLALAETDRWNTVLHPGERDPILCVTFNYDTLLEQAAASVFGHSFNHMDRYTSHPAVHVLKPHGSVTWRQSASWDQPENHWIGGHGGLSKAINQAASLDWTETFRHQIDDHYQDRDDATAVWLPAVSVPLRRKSAFTMPESHRRVMTDDLRKVTTVIAIGWRARERHFLQLLQDEMPSRPARLVGVAESLEAAKETVDNLWETGRFNAYATSALGFSGFTDSPSVSLGMRDPANVHLRDILSAATDSPVWTYRDSGSGLSVSTEGEPFIHPGYVEL